MTVEQIKMQLLALPGEDRADLALFLLRSLELDGEGEEVEEPEWDRAWGAEATRRMCEMESGKVAGIPAEDVLARLREKYP
jgi:putative addiction module component (TIGR02574 family)